MIALYLPLILRPCFVYKNGPKMRRPRPRTARGTHSRVRTFRFNPIQFAAAAARARDCATTKISDTHMHTCSAVGITL